MTNEQDPATRTRQSPKERRKTHYDLDALPSDPLPPWTYLVHPQSGLPQRQLGKKGFRAWLTNQRDGLLKCDCNFGGYKNAKVHKVHYTDGGLIVVSEDGTKRTYRLKSGRRGLAT
jgi:hypothetical protein